MTTHCTIRLHDLREIIFDILSNPHDREWSLQGFGMLRTYISDATRLHVWSHDYRVPGVSDIHNHPWHFESHVLAGEVTDHFYQAAEKGSPGARPYAWHRIEPGPTGGLTRASLKHASGDGDPVYLTSFTRTYQPGEVYRHIASHVHRSEPSDGAVTLVRRERSGDDLATVFTHHGTPWVSAKPRAATREEIDHATQRAIATYDEGLPYDITAEVMRRQIQGRVKR